MRPSRLTIAIFSKIADSGLNLTFEGATLAVLTLQKNLRLDIQFHLIDIAYLDFELSLNRYVAGVSPQPSVPL